MSRWRQSIGGIALVLVLVWLVGFPLLITLLEALGIPDAFSLAPFLEFAGRADEWRALWQSLWISAASVVLAGLIGVPLGLVFEGMEFPGRRTLGALIALPVALPPLVGVIAFLFLYGESGFVSRGVQTVLSLEKAPWRLSGPLSISWLPGRPENAWWTRLLCALVIANCWFASASAAERLNCT